MAKVKGLSALRRSFSRDKTTKNEFFDDDDDTDDNEGFSESLRDLLASVSNSTQADVVVPPDNAIEEDSYSTTSEATPVTDNTSNPNPSSQTASVLMITTEHDDSSRTSPPSSLFHRTPRNHSHNVRFAADPPELLDDIISRSDGVAEIEILKKLRDDLIQARIDLSAEKALRKKKEKNLIKLAKQLNARSVDCQAKEEQLQQAIRDREDLQDKFAQLKQELEDMTRKSEQNAREFHVEMQSHQEKYREACRNSDYRITQLSRDHAEQCEDMRALLFKANLEADRLRGLLAAQEIKHCPNDITNIINRHVAERQLVGVNYHRDRDTNKRKPTRYVLAFIIITPLALALIAAIIPQLALSPHTNTIPQLLSASFCGPLIPYISLSPKHDTTIYSDAPWWVIPASLKRDAFRTFCGDSRPRTRIALSSSGLAISQLPLFDEEIVDTMFIKWKVKDVTLRGERLVITTVDRKMKLTQEIIDAPWMKDHSQL
mmetsp:Transcript_32703/g.40194  ORF Transcript_32703/g.40194 Transcript_32703/m.40194 type:complete len:488 (+) Transcript_32703:126-1589(+)|eukprot:CAMPEP_0172493042 /NCGR_PEP_ID=MMETSP1066-20121228/24360_1 /TAXON_ID=671091 /ORGANISM="Coscinodiscus wailesii, Strain CCMP2513" /LENGTH=487 /DNA_ID=CAMNT_0013262985 /DNA_START=124 /DNA_END=1587 /DNA_ORIENTATION=+